MWVLLGWSLSKVKGARCTVTYTSGMHKSHSVSMDYMGLATFIKLILKSYFISD